MKRLVPMQLHIFNHNVMGNTSGLTEAIHPPFHFGIDVSIVQFVENIAFIHELLWDNSDGDVEPFRVGHVHV